MYTRDFATETAARTVPDAYCGNLFTEEKEPPLHNDENEGGGEASVFKSILGKGFDLKKFSIIKNGFGTEEILILGIAAFLLFSKGGDKECAIILLLSIFLS
jgi:hypothetical protein